MNLRLPEDLDAQLSRIAEAENTSKSALVTEAVRTLVESRQQRETMSAVLRSVLTEDAELMKRLEDA